MYDYIIYKMLNHNSLYDLDGCKYILNFYREHGDHSVIAGWKPYIIKWTNEYKREEKLKRICGTE